MRIRPVESSPLHSDPPTGLESGSSGFGGSLILPRTCLESVFCLLLLATLAGGSVQAQYVTDREPIGPSSRKTGLVISEIMYHPRVNPARTNDSTEFVEIYNSQPWEEDLSGFSIDGSVHYAIPSNTVLPAGAYLVVARQPELVQTNYGITNVFGP